MESKDVDVDVEDSKEEDTTLPGVIGRTPEHDTLIGIYQSVYSTDSAINKVVEFIDRVDFFLYLLKCALFGALVGWLIGNFLKMMGW